MLWCILYKNKQELILREREIKKCYKTTILKINRFSFFSSGKRFKKMLAENGMFLSFKYDFN